MGGDHKCPVCQATFTRPQHVARHMRSHTGDRPYKCQFCGDQFARSDLLSRHVNKCHPEEKPGGSAAGGRRKGTTSLSRATTSKQACDQCVQSSLPCDGSNPCAKCVQRKYRCTYVKFHRQTAPVGPGHNPGMAAASGAARSHSQDPRHPHHTPSVLGINGNLPSLNISTSGALGGNPSSRFSSLYQTGSATTSPADDFSYHLPPLSGYVGGGTTDPASLYGPSYTTAPSSARGLDDDVYGSMNRPGTASSAGSSSASGHGHGGWTTTSTTSGVYGHSALDRPLNSQRGDHPYQHSGGHHQQQSSGSQSHWNNRIPSVVGAGVGAGGHSVGGLGGGDGYPPPHDLEDLDINIGAHGHAQTFRDLFAEDFNTTTGSPLSRGSLGVGTMGQGSTGHQLDGGVSDGGSSDGGHSVGSTQSRGSIGPQRGRRRYMDDLPSTTASDPYGFNYGQRRARAGSSASSSSRPGSAHHYDSSLSPSPLITGQTLGLPGGSQPQSATNTAFSHAFDSLSLQDANALASLVAAENAAGNSATVESILNTIQASSSGGLDPDATPMAMPLRERASLAQFGLQQPSGDTPIQRPWSSLAALPPSSYSAVWNTQQQDGAEVDAYGWGGNNSMLWTPGSLLADFAFANLQGGSGGAGSSTGASGSSSSSGAAGVGGATPSLQGLGTGLTPTPGREMDTRELKEFWKMYIRTPLTGPGTESAHTPQVGGGAVGSSSSSATPSSSTAGGSQSNSTAPPANLALPTPGSGGFRRPRVNSLPSSNPTPKFPRDGAVAYLQQRQSGLGPMSSLRTTLQGPLGDGSGSDSGGATSRPPGVQHINQQEDLSSYGAAVLARKAPFNLNFARALGRMRQQNHRPSSGRMPPPSAMQQVVTSDGSQTSSSGSPSIPSRASSVGVGDGQGSNMRMSGMEGQQQEHVVRPRPSVKRLASSVLESDVAKVGRFEDDDAVASQGSAGGDATPSVLAAPRPSIPLSMPQASAGESVKNVPWPPVSSAGIGHHSTSGSLSRPVTGVNTQSPTIPNFTLSGSRLHERRSSRASGHEHPTH